MVVRGWGWGLLSIEEGGFRGSRRVTQVVALELEALRCPSASSGVWA